jgi:hypothetical protein
MIFELEVKDPADIHLIVCALSAYHIQIHPTKILHIGRMV